MKKGLLIMILFSFLLGMSSAQSSEDVLNLSIQKNMIT